MLYVLGHKAGLLKEGLMAVRIVQFIAPRSLQFYLKLAVTITDIKSDEIANGFVIYSENPYLVFLMMQTLQQMALLLNCKYGNIYLHWSGLNDL